MSAKLLAIVAAPALANGASLAVAHGLIDPQGNATIPDLICCDVAGVDVTADDTNVTFTNSSGAVASPSCWAEVVDSKVRALGVAGSTTRDDIGTPRPFIFSGGSGSSALVDLQGAYDNGANGRITLDATRLGVDIRDNGTPIGPAGTYLFSVTDAGGLRYMGVNNQGLSGQTVTARSLALDDVSEGATALNCSRSILEVTPTGYDNSGGAFFNTELNDVYYNLSHTVTFAGGGGGGTLALQRAFRIAAPTYAQSGGAKTITTAATLAISGAPTAGASVTITNPLALYVQAGAVAMGGVKTLTTGQTYPALYVENATPTLSLGRTGLSTSVGMQINASSVCLFTGNVDFLAGGGTNTLYDTGLPGYAIVFDPNNDNINFQRFAAGAGTVAGSLFFAAREPSVNDDTGLLIMRRQGGVNTLQLVTQGVAGAVIPGTHRALLIPA